MSFFDREKFKKLFTEKVFDEQIGSLEYSKNYNKLLMRIYILWCETTAYISLIDQENDKNIFSVGAQFADDFKYEKNKIFLFKGSDKPILTFQVKPTPSLKMKI